MLPPQYLLPGRRWLGEAETDEECGRKSDSLYKYQAFSRVVTPVEVFKCSKPLGYLPHSSSVTANAVPPKLLYDCHRQSFGLEDPLRSAALPGRRYCVGNPVEARTCTANQISSRIPHPSLRDTFPPGEGFVETASFCFGLRWEAAGFGGSFSPALPLHYSLLPKIPPPHPQQTEAPIGVPSPGGKVARSAG